ncbi:MAG: DUF6090 family protein [Saprospiraceae bacterium]
MKGNKVIRYLKYAFGEIILVVIGILIALQINTWNQERLDEKEKTELLEKLHAEFKENKKALSDYLVVEDKVIGAGIALINLIGTTKDELNTHNLDSLLSESFPANELAFSDNAINNITQNGRLNLFKNEAIETLLYQWNSLGKIRNTRLAKLDQWNNEIFIPYLLPYVSLKQIDSNSNFVWTGKSKVKPDYYPLFQKVEFENLLDNMLWMNHQIKQRLVETDLLIDRILKETAVR